MLHEVGKGNMSHDCRKERNIGRKERRGVDFGHSGVTNRARRLA